MNSCRAGSKSRDSRVINSRENNSGGRKAKGRNNIGHSRVNSNSYSRVNSTPEATGTLWAATYLGR